MRPLRWTGPTAALALLLCLALAPPAHAQTLTLPATAPATLVVGAPVIVRPIVRDVLGRPTSVSRVIAMSADTTIIAISYVSGGQRLTPRRAGETRVHWIWDRTDGRRLQLSREIRVVASAPPEPEPPVDEQPPIDTLVPPDPPPPVDTVPPPVDTIAPLPGGDIARAEVLALMGPMVPIAENLAAGGDRARYERRFAAYADSQWTWYGFNWQTANYYDRAAIYYVHWARGGPPSDTARARQLVANYRDTYLRPNDYNTQPHMAQLDGLALDWLVRGDSLSRAGLLRYADRMMPFADGVFQYFDTLGGRDVWESRIQARVILAQWLASRIDPTTPKWQQRVDRLVPRALAMQSADGAWRTPQACHASLNYMSGMLLDVLTRISDAGNGSPAITDAITRGATYLWASEWVATAGAFRYVAVPCGTVGGTNPAPDLNGFFLPAFGWLAAHTNDPTWHLRGDAILHGMPGPSLHYSKQFNESYTSSYRYFGYVLP